MPTEATLEFQFRSRRFLDAQKGLEVLARDIGTSAQRLAPELAQELQRYLDEVRRALLRRHSKAFRNPQNAPATGEKDLLRRSGGIRDVRVIVSSGADLSKVRGELVVPFPISVHEEGATITARRARFLTIPMPAALDSRGIPLRRRARDWTSTFVQRSRRGNLLIFQRRGASIVPLYLLKRQVTLPPRLKAQQTLEAGQDFFVDEAIDRLTRRLLASF